MLGSIRSDPGSDPDRSAKLWIFAKPEGARLERAGALKDPEHVPGLEGSLAFDFTDSQTEFIRNRQVLYVLEYDKAFHVYWLGLWQLC